jgi:imidazoleglycerol-phosphate dehydratase/histidinol-phosphatase
MSHPILFIDRDGTLIEEPDDQQVDAISKFRLVAGVIPALLRLWDAGYRFVMVTNQDGLGSDGYPQRAFDEVQRLLLGIFESQGIVFDEVLVCPHRGDEGCNCRKPGIGLVAHRLIRLDWDRARSAVVGDRQSDLDLATNMGIAGFRIGRELGWQEVAKALLDSPRTARVMRKTKETSIEVSVNLDPSGEPVAAIATGLGFFDHMLEQIGRHGGIDLRIQVQGDLHIDDHHTIEDTGIALGAALRSAIGDKRGIGRFGFYLPMDDASARVALDLSGRSFSRFDGTFTRDKVGDLSTEMVAHFFRSVAEGLQANLHIIIDGENNHHLVEVAFKGFGRCLREAVRRSDPSGAIPSTKGVL